MILSLNKSHVWLNTEDKTGRLYLKNGPTMNIFLYRKRNSLQSRDYMVWFILMVLAVGGQQMSRAE